LSIYILVFLPYFSFFQLETGVGAGGLLLNCFVVNLYFFIFLPYFSFQLDTGVGAGGLLLNRQFPPPLTIEHGPDITKEKKNHAKWVEHVYFNCLVFLQSIQ